MRRRSTSSVTSAHGPAETRVRVGKRLSRTVSASTVTVQSGVVKCGHVSVSVKNRGEAKVGRRGAMDSETKEAIVDGEAECCGACGKARLKFQMVSLKISRRPMRRVCPRIGRARRYESERHRPL